MGREKDRPALYLSVVPRPVSAWAQDLQEAGNQIPSKSRGAMACV
jgi:hypothetical protein